MCAWSFWESSFDDATRLPPIGARGHSIWPFPSTFKKLYETYEIVRSYGPYTSYSTVRISCTYAYAPHKGAYFSHPRRGPRHLPSHEALHTQPSRSAMSLRDIRPVLSSCHRARGFELSLSRMPRLS